MCDAVLEAIVSAYDIASSRLLIFARSCSCGHMSISSTCPGTIVGNADGTIHDGEVFTQFGCSRCEVDALGKREHHRCGYYPL